MTNQEKLEKWVGEGSGSTSQRRDAVMALAVCDAMNDLEAKLSEVRYVLRQARGVLESKQ